MDKIEMRKQIIYIWRVHLHKQISEFQWTQACNKPKAQIHFGGRIWSKPLTFGSFSK